MDVLVCATQVPFRHAGAASAAEDLLPDLVDALAAGGHRAEAVLVPAVRDADRLLDAALAWRLVPLDADLVIALDFPSYFARHRRKVAWLADHAVGDDRGTGLEPGSSDDLDRTWAEDLRQVVDWDIRALAEARHRYAVSEQVADGVRRRCGLSTAALPAPPPLADRLRPRAGGPGSFVLHVARPGVDGRPSLFLAGLAATTRPIPGVVASLGRSPGTLPADVERLRLGHRVHLPRSVSDATLVDLFANAIAVVHTPATADPGVTLQAFRAGVPVVTSADSGPVLEWVEHGVTGLVTDGTAPAVGRAIDRLAADPDLAARLGAAGRARVADLGWERVVGTLTATDARSLR